MDNKENKILSIVVISLILIFLSFLIYNLTINFRLFKTKNDTEIIESIIDEDYVLSKLMNDPQKGLDDPLITIYLFADYETDDLLEIMSTVNKIIKRYPDSVNFVWKDFPLVTHYFAKGAALAVRCAGEENKYWEYQEKLLNSKKRFSFETYKDIANEIGINLSDFLLCYQSQKYLVDIEYNINEAYVLDVKDVPTLFINQEKYSGDISFEKLDQVIGSLIK